MNMPARLRVCNAVGNIGGFVGPSLIGVLLDRTGSFAAPSVLMASCLTVAGVLYLLMPRVLGLPPGVSTASFLMARRIQQHTPHAQSERAS
jgi:nitrate/nitrite transporter NarK